MAAREPAVWRLPNGLRREWRGPESLLADAATLAHLVDHGIIPELDAKVVKFNLQHSEPSASGGEAEVHIVRWQGASSGDVVKGQRVALKIYRRPDGRGGFKEVEDEGDVYSEALCGHHALRKEVNLLSILHHSGYADRVPPVLGVVQHLGSLKDMPLYGYAMPAYHYGSLASLIRDTCDRRVPENVFANFFSPRRMTAEFSALMETLVRLHTGEQGLMLQDLSSNNLLVEECVGGTCRLLLADPSMCQLISHLDCPDSRYLVSTWLWGSLATRYKQFDRTADNFSLSFCFLEVWLCAEGAPVPLYELVQISIPCATKAEGHAFTRALCVAMLKRHASGGSSIVPRICRELPVSWLTLWLLLLGTEDHSCKQQLDNKQAHRRPAEADMVDSAAQLAAVSADVEALGGGLTAESLATPAGEALVARCLHLHERLASLSQLEPPQGSPLVPLDGSLSWVATHFMAQDHPLVAAMRAAQGMEATAYKLEAISPKQRSFQCAVQDAQVVAGCEPSAHIAARDQANLARDEAMSALNQAIVAGQGFQQLLGSMCQEYGRLRDLALGLLPPYVDRGPLLEIGHLDPYLQQCIHQLYPVPGTAPSGAAAGTPPAAAGPAAQPADQAGPPLVRPLGPGFYSMPPLPPAPWPLSIPAMRAGAASMPALPLAGIAGLSIADAPPLLFVRAAAAPASLQGLPAQLAAAAAAASAGAPALGGISVPGSSAAAGAAARPPTASRLVQPGAVSPAPGTYGPAPSSSNMPDLSAAAAAGAGLQYAPSPALVPPFGSLHGLSSAVAAVPGSPAAFPPPSFLQQPAGLAAAPGDAASPSADLSSRTVAGGPGDASPATSGGSGLSSPNKRKRGAEQRSVLLPPGTVLRFSASRDGSLVGLRAFRLPGHTRFSNWFALMTAQLSRRFQADMHELLALKQGPYAALQQAYGLTPAQLDSLVAGGPAGCACIEVSAASFLLPSDMQVDPRAFTTAAPIIFRSAVPSSGVDDQQIQCGGGTPEERAQYSAALCAHIKFTQGLTKLIPSAMLFRLAAAQLPAGAASPMPWVEHAWAVPAAELGAMVERAKKLMAK